MNRSPLQTTMEIGPGRIERLRGAFGLRLTCHGGTVWITQEGRVRDDFLSAGKSIELVSSGLTLIESIGRTGASLTIESTRSDCRVEPGADRSPRVLA